MIGCKILVQNSLTQTIQVSTNPAKATDTSTQIGQKSIAETQLKAEKSLCERIFKVLRDFFESIRNCFQQCFKKSETKPKNSSQVLKGQKEEPIEHLSKDSPALLSEVNADKSWDDPIFFNKKFVDTMALMFSDQYELACFHDCTKRGEDPKDPKKDYSFNAQEQAKRYEDLKKAIEEIPSGLIDRKIHVLSGWDPFETTLLLYAIITINDADKRLEIVNLLLSKGADPTTKGKMYEDVDPVEEADKKEDPRVAAALLGINDLNQLSLKAVEEACDLMIPHPLNWIGPREYLVASKTHSAEILNKNHLKLRGILSRILPEHMNHLVEYRIGGDTIQVTLLLQALLEIKDLEKCKDILQILLRKGADSQVPGKFANGEIKNLLSEAETKGNEELLNLLLDSTQNK